MDENSTAMLDLLESWQNTNQYEKIYFLLLHVALFVLGVYFIRMKHSRKQVRPNFTNESSLKSARQQESVEWAERLAEWLMRNSSEVQQAIENARSKLNGRLLQQNGSKENIQITKLDYTNIDYKVTRITAQKSERDEMIATICFFVKRLCLETTHTTCSDNKTNNFKIKINDFNTKVNVQFSSISGKVKSVCKLSGLRLTDSQIELENNTENIGDLDWIKENLISVTKDDLVLEAKRGILKRETKPDRKPKESCTENPDQDSPKHILVTDIDAALANVNQNKMNVLTPANSLEAIANEPSSLDQPLLQVSESLPADIPKLQVMEPPSINILPATPASGLFDEIGSLNDPFTALLTNAKERELLENSSSVQDPHLNIAVREFEPSSDGASEMSLVHAEVIPSSEAEGESETTDHLEDGEESNADEANSIDNFEVLSNHIAQNTSDKADEATNANEIEDVQEAADLYQAADTNETENSNEAQDVNEVANLVKVTNENETENSNEAQDVNETANSVDVSNEEQAVNSLGDENPGIEVDVPASEGTTSISGSECLADESKISAENDEDSFDLSFQASGGKKNLSRPKSYSTYELKSRLIKDLSFEEFESYESKRHKNGHLSANSFHFGSTSMASIATGKQNSNNNNLRAAASQPSLSSPIGYNPKKSSALLIEVNDKNNKRYYHVPPAMARKGSYKKNGAKIHVYRGHMFTAHHFNTSPQICAVCNLPLPRRIGKQGYLCRDCKTITHKGCHNHIKDDCQESSFSSLEIEYLGSTNV